MEMGIAATLLAALILGAILGIQKLNFERKLGQARNEIPLTITAAVNAFATQASTADLNTPTTGKRILSAMNIWPEGRVANKGLETAIISGHFQGSGEEMMTNTTVIAPRIRQSGQGFAYWITNIPADACMPLVQTLLTHRSVAGVWAGASTLNPSGGVSGTLVSSVGNNGLLSMNVGSASTACSGNNNKTLVAIIARS